MIFIIKNKFNKLEIGPNPQFIIFIFYIQIINLLLILISKHKLKYIQY